LPDYGDDDAGVNFPSVADPRNGRGGGRLPDLIPIESPDDARLEPYRAVRERDLVGRQGLFVAEGEVVLRMLLAQSRHAPVSLLLAQKRVAKLAPLLANLSSDVPVYVAAQAVMDAIVGFPIHRGVLAVARRAAPLDPAGLLASLPRPALVLALVGIANHDNMGGLFRNAAAFGVGAVLLDAACCDPLYRKAIRVSVGAALTTPFVRLAPGEDLVGLLTAHRFEPLALSPRAETPLSELSRPERAAVVVGPEGPGLPDDLLARCRGVGIPMASGVDSLNVAVAAALALHHLRFVGAS
jgi:tRNA G18 (ribose-2'-O)-methylase SpoU